MTTGDLRMSPVEAAVLSDRIRDSRRRPWPLIERAWSLRAWQAMGYGGWGDYCAAEIPPARQPGLSRARRPAVVASMRDLGLSLREIAAATGLGVGTVHRELAARVPSGTPEGASPPDPSVPSGTPAGGPARRTLRVVESQPKPAPPAAPPPAAARPTRPDPDADMFTGMHVKLVIAELRVWRVELSDGLAPDVTPEIAGRQRRSLTRVVDVVPELLRLLEEREGRGGRRARR